MKALQKLLFTNRLATITTALFLLFAGNFETVAQERILLGTVYDENGDPIPGVNVSVKGIQRAVDTDLDGRYCILVQLSEILTFSHVGYEACETPIYTYDNLDATLQDETYVCVYPGYRQRTFLGRIFHSIGNLFRKDE